MTIQAQKQLLSPGDRIELFDLDLRDLGGNLYHFVSSTATAGATVAWQGRTYTPMPIEASDFEVSGQGTLPQPKLRMSNVLLMVSTIINALGDPLGGKLTRWVTFVKYLDGQPAADANQHFIPQHFVIERKTVQTNVYVEFELSAPMDQEGRYLPGRQVLRDTCTHRYRRWDADTSSFDYARATCPWAGSDGVTGGAEGPYYDELDHLTTDPTEDRCGKRLASCKLRFGQGTTLPTRAFPAVSRIR